MFDRVNSSDGGEMPKERSRQKKKKKGLPGKRNII